MFEMCPDRDPRAAFNLEPRENVTRSSLTFPGFLLLGRQTVTFICFDAVWIPLSLYPSCTMKLMRRDRRHAQLPNGFLLSHPLRVNLQDGLF